MVTTEALIAHLLRRTSFGPIPGQVTRLAPLGVDAAVDAVLAALPISHRARGSLTRDDTSSIAKSWLARMTHRSAGLHEKMVWFWHGHFTSATSKVDSAGLMALQHNLLRLHALGNFRELAYAITIDPAMLVYLDGDDSDAGAPNENYSREFMELFTIGRTAGYTQQDVVNGAIALAGWEVHGAVADFDDNHAYHGSPLPFLGTSVATARDVTDACCDHPNCAPFIVTKLHRFLAGVDPSSTRRSELAALFIASGLEIRPVVEDILRHPTFMLLRLNRPRFPVEWISAARLASGVTSTKDALRLCEDMGQIPYEPPNVAGWAPGTRWLSASHALARAAFATRSKPYRDIADAADPVAAALARCSLFEVSDATRGALDDFAAAVGDPKKRAQGLLALALASPEFALA